MIVFTSVTEKLAKLQDDRVVSYPLMSSIYTPATILLIYFIFIRYIGPYLMKDRPPLKLDGVVRIYNIIQVVLNAIVFVKSLRHIHRVNFYCTPWDGSDTDEALDMIRIHYYYNMFKILDLVDTVFFVLRKKNKQVTFLHVYHHILMVLTAWVSCKYVPGGLSYFPITINTFVHCVMYYYYYLANKQKSKEIWWKQYITVMQLMQNSVVTCISFTHFINNQCTYSKFIALWYGCNGIIMISLFLNFYYQSYAKSKRGQKKEKL